MVAPSRSSNLVSKSLKPTSSRARCGAMSAGAAAALAVLLCAGTSARGDPLTWTTAALELLGPVTAATRATTDLQNFISTGEGKTVASTTSAAVLIEQTELLEP